MVREADGAVAADVSVADLTTYGVSPSEEGELCPSCFCDEISEENPRASLPGCTVAAHKCCVSGCIGRLKAAGRMRCVTRVHWPCFVCKMSSLLPQTAHRPNLLHFRVSRYVKSDDGLPPPTYFCQGCCEDKRRSLEVQAVLRELEVLAASGCDMAQAVERLKSAHALKLGDDSINTHHHSALDGRLAVFIDSSPNDTPLEIAALDKKTYTPMSGAATNEWVDAVHELFVAAYAATPQKSRSGAQELIA